MKYRNNRYIRIPLERKQTIKGSLLHSNSNSPKALKRDMSKSPSDYSFVGSDGEESDMNLGRLYPIKRMRCSNFDKLEKVELENHKREQIKN